MPRDLRLLCFDGGGIRCLSSLYILRSLMRKIAPKAKPCDHFDMIGGASTGGLIAIMLGRLEMSVQECIDAYTSLSSEIFAKGNRKLFPVSWRGKLKSRFDFGKLEREIKEMVRRRGLEENELLAGPNAKCKV